MTTITLEDILGADLAEQLGPTARVKLNNAIRENADGVRRLVADVLADARIHNPVGVILSRTDRGQHRATRSQATAARRYPPPPAPPDLTPAELAARKRWTNVWRLCVGLKATTRVQAAIRDARLVGTDPLDAAERELARKDTHA